MTGSWAEEGVSVGELLAGYAGILAELRRRGVVRSANAQAGDYAEWLSATALGGKVVDNFSVKSHDLILPDGRLVQVKARVTADPPGAGQLQTSPFRSWDFDVAAFVLFRDDDYEVRRGALVPLEVVRSQASFRERVNGPVVIMRSALLDHEDALNIPHGLRDAAAHV